MIVLAASYLVLAVVVWSVANIKIKTKKKRPLLAIHPQVAYTYPEHISKRKRKTKKKDKNN
jgi:hypothetical protein